MKGCVVPLAIQLMSHLFFLSNPSPLLVRNNNHSSFPSNPSATELSYSCQQASEWSRISFTKWYLKGALLAKRFNAVFTFRHLASERSKGNSVSWIRFCGHHSAPPSLPEPVSTI